MAVSIQYTLLMKEEREVTINDKVCMRCWYEVYANESHLHQVLINKGNSQIYSFNTEMLQCRDSSKPASLILLSLMQVKWQGPHHSLDSSSTGEIPSSRAATDTRLHMKEAIMSLNALPTQLHQIFNSRNINLPTLYLVPDTFIRTTSAAWAGLPACRRGVACDMTRFVSRPSLFLRSSS